MPATLIEARMNCTDLLDKVRVTSNPATYVNVFLGFKSLLPVKTIFRSNPYFHEFH